MKKHEVIAYIRKEVINYFCDSGYSFKDAKKKVSKMPEHELCDLYDNEPYFQEEGK